MCNSEKCAPWALLFLRLVTGAILIAHGYPKLVGDRTMMLGFFGKLFPFAPSFMLTLTGLIEVVGGAMLILGLFTSIAATVLAVEFLYIVIMVKSGWSAREMDLLMLASVVSLCHSGAGSISCDSKMKKGGMAMGSKDSQPMNS